MPKKQGEITIHSSAAEYLTYVAAVCEHADSMELRYADENIWLTQKKMAVLYDVSVSTIRQFFQTVQNKLLQRNLWLRLGFLS